MEIVSAVFDMDTACVNVLMDNGVFVEINTLEIEDAAANDMLMILINGLLFMISSNHTLPLFHQIRQNM